MKTKTKNKTKKLALICVAIVLMLAILLLVAFIPKHAKLYNFDKDVSVGIDVSEHNRSIEWDKVKNDADFAFIRVGYRGYSKGSLSLDEYCQENLIGANKNDVPIGVYFYSQAITADEAREEAEMVLDAIKGYKIDLPIVLDYEYAYDENGEESGRLFDAHLSKKQSTKIINEFCQTVEKAGYIPGVYASTYLYYQAIDTKRLPKSTVVWVADYNDEISYIGKYNIWQYTKHGKCDGVNSKYVDMNYWYK